MEREHSSDGSAIGDKSVQEEHRIDVLELVQMRAVVMSPGLKPTYDWHRNKLTSSGGCLMRRKE